MTQKPANITVTAQIANGHGTYWARAEYCVVPKGNDQFLFAPTSFEVLYEVDEELEALTKGLAVSPLPPPPSNAANHVELEAIVWKTENIADESKASLTPEGARKLKDYVKRNYAKFFPERPEPLRYRFSPN